jgi:hypothetical protein
MKVTARWHRFTRYAKLTASGTVTISGEFLPDAESVELEARETPKMLNVTLPSGHVQRVVTHDKTGRRMKSVRVYVRGRTFDTFFIEFQVPTAP